jgi:hypothetical protein
LKIAKVKVRKRDTFKFTPCTLDFAYFPLSLYPLGLMDFNAWGLRAAKKIPGREKRLFLF